MRALLAILAAGFAAAQSFSGATAIDAVINQAVHDDLIPGAVLIVGHDGKILYRKAYGERSLIPARETMMVSPGRTSMLFWVSSARFCGN